MIITTDDVCLENLKYFKYFDWIKEINNNFVVHAFVIANYKNEKIYKNKEFINWYNKRKNWVKVGLHGWDHGLPQEGWRHDQEKYIEKSLDKMRSFLGDYLVYRPPGFRVLPKTEKILRNLGFNAVAHKDFIKDLNTGSKLVTYDTHCCDKFDKPITKVWQNILNQKFI